MAKNVGGNMNPNLMKRLVGLSHNADVSHIRVTEETRGQASSIKPTKEEFERWERGEDISQQAQSVPRGPGVSVKEENKAMIKNRLMATAGTGTTISEKIQNLPPQTATRMNDNIEFNYTRALHSPPPDLTKSYFKPSSVNPELPTRVSNLVEVKAYGSEIQDLLNGLGSALVENAGGQYGITSYTPVGSNWTQYIFQHGSLQIEINNSDRPTAIVSIALDEGTALTQSVTRTYKELGSLLQDLPNLIDAVGNVP